MKKFFYIRATSVKDAVQQASTNNNAMFIAGGTNLVDRMKVFLDEPSQLIDITRLEMTRIEQTRDGLSLGALVSNTAVADHPEVRRNASHARACDSARSVSANSQCCDCRRQPAA